MSEAKAAAGPDFSAGIALSEIADGATIAGRAGDEPVLLSRLDGALFAIGGTCTHYGGHLADGVIDGDVVRCPLHHACFDLRTGAVLRAPALDPVDRWQTEIEGDRVFVRRRLETEPSPDRHAGNEIGDVVIVGGGAAGLACAHALRSLGYQRKVTIVSADPDPPCDRPNLSKDYLAGSAPEEWLSLRGEDWYAANRIDLQLGTEVIRIDAAAKTIHCASGAALPFGRLLIATGSEPNRLNLPGFDRDNVFTLRSIGDARAIAARSQPGTRVAVIGASFIAMEAAAALRKRGAQVSVVSVEEVPFERVFGTELGTHLQRLHETNGVHFHLGSVVAGYDGSSVILAGGQMVTADFVLVGIGVKPRIAVAQSAGLATGNGVDVDAFLETGIPGIYAAGDIASYPDPHTGERVRIEHWVTAERQGQVAAANMLGAKTRFDAVPFFWTEQFGVTLRYVGRASGWDAVTLEGDFESGSLIARYFTEGRHCATASIGRDRENLEDELMLENRILAGAEI